MLKVRVFPGGSNVLYAANKANKLATRNELYTYGISILTSASNTRIATTQDIDGVLSNFKITISYDINSFKNWDYIIIDIKKGTTKIGNTTVSKNKYEGSFTINYSSSYERSNFQVVETPKLYSGESPSVAYIEYDGTEPIFNHSGSFGFIIK